MRVRWESKTLKPMHAPPGLQYRPSDLGPTPCKREGLTRHAGRQTLDVGNVLYRYWERLCGVHPSMHNSRDGSWKPLPPNLLTIRDESKQDSFTAYT